MPSLSIVGAHLLCYINGRLFGKVSSLSWNSATPRKEIYGLDAVDPIELAPTTTKLQGTLGLYRLAGDGGLEGAGIAAHFSDLPAEKYFSIQVIDRRTDLPVFEAVSCCVESQSWSVAARGLLMGTVTFRGISWNNEVDPGVKT